MGIFKIGSRCSAISTFDLLVGHMIFELYFVRNILADPSLRIITCRLLHFVTIQLFLTSQKHMPFSGIILLDKATSSACMVLLPRFCIAYASLDGLSVSFVHCNVLGRSKL